MPPPHAATQRHQPSLAEALFRDDYVREKPPAPTDSYVGLTPNSRAAKMTLDLKSLLGVGKWRNEEQSPSRPPHQPGYPERRDPPEEPQAAHEKKASPRPSRIDTEELDGASKPSVVEDGPSPGGSSWGNVKGPRMESFSDIMRREQQEQQQTLPANASLSNAVRIGFGPMKASAWRSKPVSPGKKKNTTEVPRNEDEGPSGQDQSAPSARRPPLPTVTDPNEFPALMKDTTTAENHVRINDINRACEEHGIRLKASTVNELVKLNNIHGVLKCLNGSGADFKSVDVDEFAHVLLRTPYTESRAKNWGKKKTPKKD
eukprot:GHVO01052727.1.p1 GENE.GHVO01052727.1~~GHVO01052727.1.p1  ORF type:complete len:324 (+),score=70.95 GHVO01052727.1:27-974(+)